MGEYFTGRKNKNLADMSVCNYSPYTFLVGKARLPITFRKCLRQVKNFDSRMKESFRSVLEAGITDDSEWFLSVLTFDDRIIWGTGPSLNAATRSVLEQYDPEATFDSLNAKLNHFARGESVAHRQPGPGGSLTNCRCARMTKPHLREQNDFGHPDDDDSPDEIY